MSIRIVSAGLLLFLFACTAGKTPDTKVVNARSFEGLCAAERVQSLIGKTMNDHVRQEALLRSGASVVRVIQAGEGMTLDIDTGRLTILTDATGKILRLSCE